MRLWPTCLALLLGATLAGSASAAVYSRGLACSPLGFCVLQPSADESSLTLDNLGHSSEDGVSIDLPLVTGHSLTCSSSCLAGTHMTYAWTFTRGPRQTTSLDMTRTSSGLLLTGDLFVFGGASEQRRFVYMLDNTVVASQVVSSCPGVELRLSPAVALTIPAVSLCSENGVYVFSVTCTSTFQCTIDGANFDCNRVVVCTETNGAGDCPLSSCRLTCSLPPGSSFSSLVLSSQSITRFGQTVTASEGTIRFTGDDFLGCAIGSQSSDNGLDVQQSLYRYMFGLSGSALTSTMTAPLSLALDSPPVDMVFLPHAGHLLGGADAPVSGSLRCTLTGSHTCSPDGVVAAIEPRSILKSFFVDTHFSSMCAVSESVIVLSHGDVVARLPLAVDGTIEVQAPPGGTQQMALAKTGRPSNMGWDLAKGTKVVTTDVSAPRESDFSSAITSGRVPLHVQFLDERVFLFGGHQVTGDDIVVVGQSATPPASGAVLTISGTSFRFSRTDAGQELDIQDFSPNGGDVVVASIPAGSSLSTTHTVLVIPVDFDRLDSTPVRGVSVTFSLSALLQLAGPVLQGSYLSRSGQTQMFTTHNADGSYTVDCALLGPGCGPTDSGRLFTIPVSLACSPGACAPVDGADAFVDISNVEVADCNAGPVPGDPGGRFHFQVDTSPPSMVTGLTVIQQKSGNPPGETTRRILNWTAVPDERVELYRAPFGNYPRYGKGPNAGSVPPQPTSYPPNGRWLLVSTLCGSNAAGATVCSEQSTDRDFDYFDAFAIDRAGNISPPCPMTPGCLNYHLGDVAGGGAPCQGDNLVATLDISRLGSRYGAVVVPGTTDECLDYGAATVDSKPDVDGRIGFRELLMAAINFSLVSVPADVARPAAAAVNEMHLSVPALPTVGQTFDVALRMSGAGDALAVSTQLAWDPAVVEPIGVTQGELVGRQGRDGVVLSSQPGNVDAALLGVGPGIAGEGELARVSFRVKAAGDPGIGIAGVEARDPQARALAIGFTGTPNAAPAHTALRLAFPNPFERSTTVVFALAHSGPASVRVYDVAGRNVRTLVTGVQPAGERVIAWDGRDDSGTQLGAGVYMLRLDAAGHQETRALRLVK